MLGRMWIIACSFLSLFVNIFLQERSITMLINIRSHPNYFEAALVIVVIIVVINVVVVIVVDFF